MGSALAEVPAIELEQTPKQSTVEDIMSRQMLAICEAAGVSLEEVKDDNVQVTLPVPALQPYVFTVPGRTFSLSVAKHYFQFIRISCTSMILGDRAPGSAGRYARETERALWAFACKVMVAVGPGVQYIPPDLRVC